MKAGGGLIGVSPIFIDFFHWVPRSRISVDPPSVGVKALLLDIMARGGHDDDG